MVRSASKDAVGGDKLATREHVGLRLVKHSGDQSRIRRPGDAGGSIGPRQLAIVGSNNAVNCWNPLRAVDATTQPETANVTARKEHGLGNQQASSVSAEKLQRLEGDLVGPERVRSAAHLLSRADGDVVRPEPKGSEGSDKLTTRNN